MIVLFGFYGVCLFLIGFACGEWYEHRKWVRRSSYQTKKEGDQ
jgi:hypothetical protein